MIRHFLVKLALFSLPPIIVASIIFGFTFYIGEAMPIELVAWLSSQHPALIYGPRFGRDMSTFNLMAVNQRQPTILAIGSSRSWLVRSEFFISPDALFYNASDAGWTLDQIDLFIRQLSPEAQPEILLLGIDKPWFNPDFAPIKTTTADQPSRRPRLSTTIRATMAYVLNHPAELTDLLNRLNPVTGDFALGVDGIITGVGIRHDGSLLQGQVIQGLAPVQEMLKQHHQNLTDTTEMFVAGNQVSQTTLSQLNRFLDYAQEQGIEVIGFAPPFAPSIYARLAASGKHDYIWKLDPLLEEAFANHNFQYFDFTDPASIEAREGDFWDGWHASELITARMVASILRASESLAKYSDLNFLENAIANAVNTFDIFNRFAGE